MTMNRVLCLVSLGFWTASANLDFKRVHLVDKVGTNLLFRGNMPVNDTAFALDALLDFMHNRSASAGVAFPKDFRLIDITLNNVFDYDAKEIDFWKHAPATFGELIKWPLGFDGIVSPHDLSDSIRRSMCKKGVTTVDQLTERVQQLSGILRSEHATVVYVHCSAGCDRTGEFVAAYRLLNGDFRNGRLTPSMSRNISAVYGEDVIECGRPPNYFSTTALKWFCFCQSYKNMTFVAGPRVGPPVCSHFASCKTFGDCKPVAEAAEAFV